MWIKTLFVSAKFDFEKILQTLFYFPTIQIGLKGISIVPWGGEVSGVAIPFPSTPKLHSLACALGGRGEGRRFQKCKWRLL